jgi:hypothetical protein
MKVKAFCISVKKSNLLPSFFTSVENKHFPPISCTFIQGASSQNSTVCFSDIGKLKFAYGCSILSSSELLLLPLRPHKNNTRYKSDQN